jgi:hypothetical protein
MSENNEVLNTQDSQATESDATNENLRVMMAQFMSQNDIGYQPTKRQFDRIIDIREKAMDYTHKERTQVSPKYKTDSILKFFFFIGAIVTVLFISERRPEYLDAVITAFLGFIGGYGYAKQKPSINQELE